MLPVVSRLEPSSRVSARLGSAAGGALIALVLAEFGAGLARGFAFPHVNIFRADDRYGATLEPHADTRVRTRGGRVTSVRTNALGFRGEPWTFEGRGALLLGDSQVFGFGVEQEETMAGRLSAAGYPAMAAAVPSWGPPEFALAAEDWVGRLQPRFVVFFANLANDWIEARVPNAVRSDARDGWLTRAGGEAPSVRVPGRRVLFGRSQLVYSARALHGLWRRRPESADFGLGAPAAIRMVEMVAELSGHAPPHRSRITPLVLRTVEACAAICSVIVAVLPMDVQVDPAAWAKYRRKAVDLSGLRRLSDDLLADLAELQIAAVDLSAALGEASPGTFLEDDPHLSPRGHDVVARALARSMLGSTAPVRPEDSP